MTSADRPEWTVPAPAGGWAPPWPQTAELARAIPSETVDTSRRVDGAAARRARRSTLEPTHSRYRPTVDVDMVLHIETGATTFPDVRDKLEDLGYEIQMPAGDGPVHRFTRHNSEQQVGVMVADNLSPRFRPTVKGRPVFGIPAGTSALQKTVNCEIDVNGTTTRLSVPTVLGALVLKGEAYRQDDRDRDRHLDDAAILACAIVNPVTERNSCTRASAASADPLRYLSLMRYQRH